MEQIEALKSIKTYPNIRYWISLTDNGGNQSMDKREQKLAYTNWKQGEPNGKATDDKYCVYLDSFNRKWAMEKCTTGKFFPLCEKGTEFY
jgi:hypothetical protein